MLGSRALSSSPPSPRKAMPSCWSVPSRQHGPCLALARASLSEVLQEYCGYTHSSNRGLATTAYKHQICCWVKCFSMSLNNSKLYDSLRCEKAAVTAVYISTIIPVFLMYFLWEEGAVNRQKGQAEGRVGERKLWNNLCGSGQLYEICIQLSNYRQRIKLQRAQPGKELGAKFNFQKQRLQTVARILLQSGLSSNKHPYGPRAWDLSLPKLWVTWQISPQPFSKRAEVT